jgi:hypothetical protein
VVISPMYFPCVPERMTHMPSGINREIHNMCSEVATSLFPFSNKTSDLVDRMSWCLAHPQNELSRLHISDIYLSVSQRPDLRFE